MVIFKKDAKCGSASFCCCQPGAKSHLKKFQLLAHKNDDNNPFAKKYLELLELNKGIEPSFMVEVIADFFKNYKSESKKSVKYLFCLCNEIRIGFVCGTFNSEIC